MRFYYSVFVNMSSGIRDGEFYQSKIVSAFTELTEFSRSSKILLRIINFKYLQQWTDLADLKLYLTPSLIDFLGKVKL